MEIAESIKFNKRMDEFEIKLDQTFKAVHRIEQGLFGDEKIDHPGLIKKQSDQQSQINTLKEEIIKLKEVNLEQDIEIKAKKNQTDDWIKYGTRIGIAFGLVIVFTFMITGKIGLVDIISGFFSVR